MKHKPPIRTTTEHTRVTQLSSITLNSATSPPRHSPGAVKPHSERWKSNYDFHTLIYDAFQISGTSKICAIAPPLYNFEKPLREAKIRVDGNLTRIIKLKNLRKYSEIWLRGHLFSSMLEIEIFGQIYRTRLSQQSCHLFSGANAIVTMFKNDRIEWIVDWLKYHRIHHGANAALLFSNDTSRYELAQISSQLLSTSGCERIVIVEANYAYGLPDINETMFLQVSMLNLARLKYLNKARAVLLIDVDELIPPTPAETVFDATAKSLFGYTLMTGRWRWPKAGTNAQKVTHADHIMKELDDELGNTKYCIRPGGPLGRLPWTVHYVVSGRAKRYFIDPRFTYWHCRFISTNWKHSRTHSYPEDLIEDSEICRALKTAFR